MGHHGEGNSMTQAFLNASHLMTCACGAPDPHSGWMAPPMVFYAHCGACGDWVSGDTATEVAASWNLLARAALARSAA